MNSEGKRRTARGLTQAARDPASRRRAQEEVARGTARSASAPTPQLRSSVPGGRVPPGTASVVRAGIKYEERVAAIRAVLGPIAVSQLSVKSVIEWQLGKLKSHASGTVADQHGVLRSMLDAAIRVDLVSQNVAAAAPPPEGVSPVGILRPATSTASSQPLRLTASVPRWRCSSSACAVGQALGLAWEGRGSRTAHGDCAAGVCGCRAARCWDPRRPPEHAAFITFLLTVVEQLSARRVGQTSNGSEPGLSGHSTPTRPAITPCFTNPAGGLLLRARLDASRHRRRPRWIDPQGRALIVAADRSSPCCTPQAWIWPTLRDTSGTSPATTLTYVRDLGQRPVRTVDRVAQLLDPA